MPSVNKVILIGHLGRDPEIKYMPSGDAVANFSIATTETWKDKNGEKQEKTEWHRICLFGKTAELAGEYLRKGMPVYIEGRLQTREWQDKEGAKRQTTEIVGNSMQFLGSSKEFLDKWGGEAKERTANEPAPERPSKAPSKFDDLHDDLPF